MRILLRSVANGYVPNRILSVLQRVNRVERSKGTEASETQSETGHKDKVTSIMTLEMNTLQVTYT